MSSRDKIINLQFLRLQIIKLESTFQQRAKALLKSGDITPGQSSSIDNDCQIILGFAAKINSIELNEVLTDMDKAAEKIKDATDSLDKAAAKIQEAQKFVEILSPLIKLGEAVLKAIGNSSVAAIGSLVEQLRDIGESQ